MTLPFKPVSFNEEALTTDKMNQMANNDQWLFENMQRAQYRAYGLNRSSGLKILATNIVIPSGAVRQGTRPIYFSGFFSAGCQPIIQATVVPTGSQRRFLVAASGIGRAVPDHTGCNITITVSELNPLNDKIYQFVYVHVTAIGY